ncbi:MAG: histidinol-phosphate transaminase [Candidatus Caldatribacteriota bacterium]
MKKDYRFFRVNLKEVKPYDPHELPHKIKLNANENPYGLPQTIQEEILRKAQNIDFSRYPNSLAQRLSEAISHSLGLSADHIIIGNGSDELIDYLVRTFSEEGRKVISTAPCFAMYKIYSQINGSPFVGVPLSEKDFSLNEEEILEEAKKEDASLIFIAYPNAPTGNYFAAEKIIKIIEESNCMVVVDEAYYEFGGKTFLPLISRYDNLAILRTFSKAYSLAGLRVGYLLSNPKIITEVRKVKSPFNVNTFSQLAAEVIMENQERLKTNVHRIVQERERLLAKMAEISPFKVYPSYTNFILLEIGNKDNTDLVFHRLLEKGILVQVTSDPAFSHSRYFLRISIGKEEENDILLQELENIARGMGNKG